MAKLWFRLSFIDPGNLALNWVIEQPLIGTGESKFRPRPVIHEQEAIRVQAQQGSGDLQADLALDGPLDDGGFGGTTGEQPHLGPLHNKVEADSFCHQLFDVKECAAREEHLAKVGPGRLLRFGLASVKGGLFLEEFLS